MFRLSAESVVRSGSQGESTRREKRMERGLEAAGWSGEKVWERVGRSAYSGASLAGRVGLVGAKMSVQSGIVSGTWCGPAR